MSIFAKKRNLILLMLMSCSLGCQNEIVEKKPIKKVEQIPNNTLSEKEIAIGWELLFDGKKTDHWKQYNQNGFPKEDWQIDEEGNLVAQDAVEIISKRKFENFEFKLEYQLSKGSNSGVFYRVIEAEAFPIWFNAPEFSLLDDDVFLEKKIKHPNARRQVSGSVFDVLEPSSNLALPVGEWNSVRLVLHSGFVEHWLNGKRVVEAQIDSEDWRSRVQQSKFKNYLNYGKSKIGHIGLQAKGSLVKFRNIKIREL